MDKTIPMGAATTVFGLLCPELNSASCNGCYLSDCKITDPSAEAKDTFKQEALWKISEDHLAAALENKVVE